MQVKQLIENKNAFDFSPLKELWTHKSFSSVVDALDKIRDISDDADMLHSLLSTALARGPGARPESIIAFISPLLDVSHGFTGAAHLRSTDIFLVAVEHFIDTAIKKLLEVKPGLPAKLLRSAKVDLKELKKILPHTLALSFELALIKAERTAAQKKFDDENDTFVFIGRPTFVEVPPGSGNYRKTLEIENLIKIDKYNISDHKTLNALKLRARYQGENSEVYKITLPAGTVKEKYTSNLEPWLVSLIDEHKARI